MRPSHTLLLNAWAQRGTLAWLLWPLSRLYGALVWLRQQAYRCGWFKARRFAVPVVVVGNVQAGGTGKTPLVIAMVRHWQAKGVRVGVVSSGYGGQRKTSLPLEVTRYTPVEESGDEPALIKRATGAPLFVASRRANAVAALLEAYPDVQVVLSDDGLQHHALARDVGIAVFDDRGLGNGWLLPAGPLREPWPLRGHRVDWILHTGQQPAFAGLRCPRHLADHALSANGQEVPLASLQGKPVLALAGIAQPEVFFDMLRDCGLTPIRTIPLADHQRLSGAELLALLRPTVNQPPPTLLCTEKDAVKLFALPEASKLRLLAVPLVAKPEPAFWQALDARLALQSDTESPNSL